MLWIYHWKKCLTSYCFSTKVYTKRGGSLNSCHRMTSSYVKDLLSLENVYLILFECENKFMFIPKGVAVQLSPKMYVRDLSL